MPFVSHAQNAEDVVLHRVFKGQLTGFYIDVGANDPTQSSVTRSFYDAGWHGINIEPARTAFEKLRAARKRDVNLPIALSDRPGCLCFYECINESTWSTLVASEAESRKANLDAEYIERRLPVWTLAQVCERHVEGTIDFLSIDVENHERQVIAGHDWNRWRPRVVLVEDSVTAGTEMRGHLEWEHLLLKADYRFALFDGINRFYVRREDEKLLPLLSVPANVLDDYLTFDYLGLKTTLTTLQENFGALTPALLALAGWLHTLAARHPHLARAAKRFLSTTVTRFAKSSSPPCGTQGTKKQAA